MGSYTYRSMKYYPPHVLLSLAYATAIYVLIAPLALANRETLVSSTKGLELLIDAHWHHNVVGPWLHVIFELPRNEQQTSFPCRYRHIMLRLYIRLPLLELRIRCSAPALVCHPGPFMQGISWPLHSCKCPSRPY